MKDTLSKVELISIMAASMLDHSDRSNDMDIKVAVAKAIRVFTEAELQLTRGQDAS
jgi:hypothetical protein